MPILKYLLYAIIIVACGAQVQAQSIEPYIRHVVDSVYTANPTAVGFSVHVEAPNYHISYDYATGYSNRKTHQKLASRQPVLIASNTKPYVAATILRLVEQKKLRISQPISRLLTAKTRKVLTTAGYRTDSITVKHLLSHTSGIRDYVDEGYFKFIGQHKRHAWTRDEQISRATSLGGPLAGPDEGFKYADVNYLLLTEIIEQCTNKPFYKSMRALLHYKDLHLNETWFVKLEQAPKAAAPRAHQYWDEFSWDTYDLDPSWDLYGGGGMVATVKDMAMFFQYLFNGRVVHDQKVLAMMHEDVLPNLEINYCLGIRKISYAGMMGYNHGGGLGTDVIYIPQLNATIAVATMEAGHRPIALAISKEIARQISLIKR